MRVEPLELSVQVRLGYFDAEGHCVKTVLQPPGVVFHPHGAGVEHYVAERVREAQGEVTEEENHGKENGTSQESLRSPQSHSSSRAPGESGARESGVARVPKGGAEDGA